MHRHTTTARRYGLPGKGFILIERGDEGPLSDPYSFTRITIKRDGQRAVTLHEGLGLWSQIEGYNPNENRHVNHYDRFVKYAGGFSFRRIEEFCQRLERRKEERFFRETGVTYDDIRASENAAGWDPNP